ncbi:hypothetical protein ACWGLF_10870 [Streptomyces puniciscabiei]
MMAEGANAAVRGALAAGAADSLVDDAHGPTCRSTTRSAASLADGPPYCRP